MTTKPEIMERLVMQPASSSHPSIGTAYTRAGHTVDYSIALTRTRRNYYESKAEIPEGQRMSTAAEELAMQLDLERAGQDPRHAKVFDDLFARNGWYAWQWTDTFLRVPPGKSNPEKPDYIDSQGRKYWAREFGNGSEVVGIVYVPEGSGRVVPKTQDLFDVWDPITGLPRVTSGSQNDMKHENHTIHFWFNPEPRKDSKSGHQDVAVGRGGDWRHDGGDRCFGVDADYARSDAGSGGGFRPVRGSLPKIEKISADPKNAESTLSKGMEEDYGTLPLADFLKKYKL